MATSEQLDKLAEALAKAQGQMEAAELNSVNPFFKSRYADLGSIIAAAKKPLSTNGLSVVQLLSNDDARVTVTTRLLHASGQWIDSAMSLPIGEDKGRSMAQTVGALTTYLRRMGYSSLLGVYADEDADGEESGNTNGKPQPTTQVRTNGAMRQTWAASGPLIVRITNEIPRYKDNRPHAINALQELGKLGKIKLEMTDDEVFAAVNAHAKAQADAQAAKA